MGNITQKIQEIGQDAETVSKAAHEKTIVYPRIGKPFKSIPLIISELESIIEDLRNSLVNVEHPSHDQIVSIVQSEMSNYLTEDQILEVIASTNFSGYTKDQVNASLDLKANKADVYSKNETMSKEQIQSLVSDLPTTGSGGVSQEWVKDHSYSKTVTFTKDEVLERITTAVSAAQLGGNAEQIATEIFSLVEQRIDAGDLKLSWSVKYFSRAELGLHHWDVIPDEKGTEWTLEQYKQGHENGQKISDAITLASNQNYDEVKFEYGNYALTSNRQLMETQGWSVETNLGSFIVCPRGIKNIEINWGGSNLFLLWHSYIRQPYDLRTSANTWDWSARITSFPDSRNVVMKNGHIRGCMYYRDYQNPDEERKVEQGSGYFNSPNTRNLKIKNMKFSGFRGDGLSGAPRGVSLFHEGDIRWFKGGLDLKTGAEIEKSDSYRTPLLNLKDKKLVDNALQIMSSGYTRISNFRDMFIDAIFYDDAGNFVWKESIAQTDFLHVPRYATGIRFVCNFDERQTQKDHFGNFWLNLKATPTSTSFTRTYFSLTWEAGDIDAAGQNTTRENSYRSNMYDFSSVANLIFDGELSHNLNGFYADIYFYDANDKFISRYTRVMGGGKTVPSGATKVRFTTNTEEVHFFITHLCTGSSDVATLEDVEIFYCMRGGVSNMGSNLELNRVKIHTIGNSIRKHGDIDYPDATKYGINLEDAFVKKVVVKNCEFKDTFKPFIFLTREVVLDNNTFEQSESAATLGSTIIARIINNTWNRCGFSFDWGANVSPHIPRTAHIEGNQVYGTGADIWEIQAVYPHLVNHVNNTIRGNRVKIAGNGVTSHGNKYDRIRKDSQYPIEIKDVLSLNDKILGEFGGDGARYVRLHDSRRRKKSDKRIEWFLNDEPREIMLNIATPRGSSDYKESKPIYHTPMTVVSPVRGKVLLLVSRERDGFIDAHDFYDSSFEKTSIAIGTYGGLSRTYNDMRVVIEKTYFDDSDLINWWIDTAKEAVINIVLKDCHIDFDELEHFINFPMATTFKEINIDFVRCYFGSDFRKDVKIVRTNTQTNVTINSRLKDCEFENVVNIDGITTVVS